MEFNSGVVSPIGSIERGWNLIKNDYWVFFGMSAVAIVIIVILAFIFGAVNQGITLALVFATSGAGGLDPESFRNGLPLVPQVVSMVIGLVTNVVVMTLSGILFCGVYAALKKKMTQGVADFGMLFSGFQKFVPCAVFAAALSVFQFILSMVMLLVAVALGLGTAGLGGVFRGRLDGAAFGGMVFLFILLAFLILVINVVVAIMTVFVYPLVATRDASISDAIITSAKAGLSNFGGLFLMLLLVGLMIVGGFIACIIGVFFVAPLYTATHYIAFCDVFGIDTDRRSNDPPPPPTWDDPAGGVQPGY